MLTIEDINKYSSGIVSDIEMLSKPIIIFGAGVMGKTTADVLLKYGIKPAFFIDDNSDLSEYKGIPVVTPDSEEISENIKEESAVVIGVMHQELCLSAHFKSMKDKITGYGFSDFYYYEQVMVYLAIKCPDFEWYYLQDNITSLYLKDIDKINRGLSLMSDNASRKAFLGLLYFSLSAKLEYLEVAPDFPRGDPQYFLEDICDLSKIQTYVDLGAFNGDTLKVARELCPELQTAYCFEPSQNLYKELAMYAHAHSEPLKVHCLPLACSDKTGIEFFSKDSVEQLHIIVGEGMPVPCVRLDDIFHGIIPDLIKLDIEGSEKAALTGASSVIAEKTPVIAVCVYHKPDDVWTMISLIDDIAPGKYRFYLRKSMTCSWIESVVYAIPERLSVN